MLKNSVDKAETSLASPEGAVDPPSDYRVDRTREKPLPNESKERRSTKEPEC
jgi:hypothetical protein